MFLNIFCNILSEETSGRHILALQHLILFFLVLPSVCDREVPVWEPYGPVMCEQECMKQTGCKSFIFRASQLSCTLKCNLCHEDPLDVDTFCSNGSKIINESLLMGSICDDDSRALNRILCTSLNSESFFIFDLAKVSHKTEIQVGRRIKSIIDFTDTKVVIDVSLPLPSVILFDIESKEETTVLQKVTVLDMAKGESDGIVYILGEKSLKSIWKVSYPLKTEKVDYFHLRASLFEFDPLFATFYMIATTGSNKVYRRTFGKTSKPDINVPKHRFSTIALDTVTHNLYIFSEISNFQIPLLSPGCSYVHMTFRVISARFFFNEFYFSRYYESERKYKLFKMASKNIEQEEMDTTVVFVRTNEIVMSKG